MAKIAAIKSVIIIIATVLIIHAMDCFHSIYAKVALLVGGALIAGGCVWCVVHMSRRNKE